MRNYIKFNYTGHRLILSRAVAEMLENYVPKGCPFKDYTCLDLLKDTFEMYSWRVQEDMSVVDFIKMLMDYDAHMAAYGQDIIGIVEAFG